MLVVRCGIFHKRRRRIMALIPSKALAGIAALRGLSGLCFTVAAAAFGFSVNLYKDLQIQGQIPADVLSYWSAIRDSCFLASIVLGRF
jgi:hypothetical protein